MNQATILPWDDDQYRHDIATNGMFAWTERETQIYINFMELLIGKQLSPEEVDEIRKSNITDFNQNSQAIKHDVAQTETTMRQIYASNSAEVVANFREQFVAALFQSSGRTDQLAESTFVKIYNRHVQILQYDPVTHLSLSNQDIEAYIKYLQFQNMLMGQSYVVSPQEAEMLQMQLVNRFTTLPFQQKQSLAYASFIWEVVERQWSNLTKEQQQQYIEQLQGQMNIQNVSVSPQDIEASMQTQEDFEKDIQAMVEKSKAEAKSRGMSIEEYINYKQQEINANNNLYTMMQNTMTENHATMLNVINNMGDGGDYYYVDYNNH